MDDCEEEFALAPDAGDAAVTDRRRRDIIAASDAARKDLCVDALLLLLGRGMEEDFFRLVAEQFNMSELGDRGSNEAAALFLALCRRRPSRGRSRYQAEHILMGVACLGHTWRSRPPITASG